MGEPTFFKTFLIKDKYLFGKNRERLPKIYYKCRDKNCSAYIILKDGLIIAENGNHGHPDHSEYIIKKQTVSDLKNRVR